MFLEIIISILNNQVRQCRVVTSLQQSDHLIWEDLFDGIDNRVCQHIGFKTYKGLSNDFD